MNVKTNLAMQPSCQGVAKFPQRIKCATLAWNALKKTIENQEKQ